MITESSIFVPEVSTEVTKSVLKESNTTITIFQRLSAKIVNKDLLKEDQTYYNTIDNFSALDSELQEELRQISLNPVIKMGLFKKKELNYDEEYSSRRSILKAWSDSIIDDYTSRSANLPYHLKPGHPYYENAWYVTGELVGSVTKENEVASSFRDFRDKETLSDSEVVALAKLLLDSGVPLSKDNRLESSPNQGGTDSLETTSVYTISAGGYMIESRGSTFIYSVWLSKGSWPNETKMGKVKGAQAEKFKKMIADYNS